MKAGWTGACFALMLSMSALAHAQGVASAPTQANAPQMLASAQTQDATANGAITRAQVRHQLVQAERDGQLQTLDKTVYAHH